MYGVALHYAEGIQSAHVVQRRFLNPNVNTTWTPAANAKDGAASPSKNWVRPNTHVHCYKLVAAYYSLGRLLRNFLVGSITHQGSYPLTRSPVSETRLIDQRTSYPVPDLMDQIQSVYEDMLLTLLSEPNLVIADSVAVPCTKERAVNVYKYYTRGLWMAYAVTVLASFVFLLVGGVSMYSNGVESDTLFSRIMMTTQNPTINNLSVGAYLGSNPFPEELRRTKLRFRVLLKQKDNAERFGKDGLGIAKVEHCGFGTVGETKKIVKFGTYAGLKKRRKRPCSQEACESKELKSLLEDAGNDDDEG